MINEPKLEPQAYIINAGGIVAVNQLVQSTLVKNEGARSTSEYVKLRVFNKTSKRIQIKKHTILATAEPMSTEMLASMSEFTEEKAMHNYVSLIQRFSLDNALKRRDWSRHTEKFSCYSKGETVPTTLCQVCPIILKELKQR